MGINLTSQLPFASAGRQTDVVAADWTGGMNSGSCQPGVAISTGIYDHKADDWARIVIDPAQSQRIGLAPEDLLEPVDGNDTFALATADGATADGAVFNAATGAVNRTGGTIPAGVWAWGTVPVA